ncbi:hypothetical protein BDZ97DRAFT_128601 [Flammula alnicola]|nr:hypothetical protein BDZ97DRAFT_128601 [Flammula alnicola]
MTTLAIRIVLSVAMLAPFLFRLLLLDSHTISPLSSSQIPIPTSATTCSNTSASARTEPPAHDRLPRWTLRRNSRRLRWCRSRRKRIRRWISETQRRGRCTAVRTSRRRHAPRTRGRLTPSAAQRVSSASAL